jgi:signal transduction histidine kinase/CheY-like chemotaxis protein
MVRWGNDDIYEILYPVRTRIGRGREEIGLTLGGDEQTIGWARIGMSLSLKRVEETVANVNRTMAGVTFLVIVVGVLVAVLLVRFIVRPLRALADAAQRIGEGELDMKVAVTSRDEIGELATSFNTMTVALRAREADNSRLFQALGETNQRLEAASRHKSQFLANMSHELRTPLNAIIGFSEILLTEAPAGLSAEERQEFQQHILTSGRHLLRLINDILDLSKVEAGRMSLQLEPFPVAPIVEEVLASLQPLAAKKGLEVATSLDPRLDVLVADPGKVKQILYNLLSNAIKFTPAGGRLGVRATRDGQEAQFTVWDTGIGIPAQEHERIFEEFQQLQAMAGKEYEGTGLGLALARKFVELHGGRIWVESEPGQGSSFTFVLPGLPARTAEPPPLTTEDIGRPLVLVVEDDPKTRELLRFSLSRAGYRVDEASDGDQALARARATRPALITLDIRVPGKDGWQVLQELKQDPETWDIPVVIVSIVDDPQRGYSLGAADYILKPFERDDLLRRLARLGLSTNLPVNEGKVLVVSDDEGFMERLTAMLEGAGFRTLQGHGGHAGLALAIEERPHVVLVNLLMHEMTGFEFMHRFRGQPVTKDIPIFVVTDADLDAEKRGQLNERAAAVIQNARFSTDALLEEVSRLIRARVSR